ncbi:hypothetical protein D3C80_806490 [compost metagenome]
MHRLAQFEQHEVGNVNNRVDRTNATATQFFFHPQRRWGLNVDAFHYATQITRASISCLDLNRQRVGNSCRHWRDFWRVQIGLIQYGHIASHADNA